MGKRVFWIEILVLLGVLFFYGCAAPSTVYHDPNMDFGAIQTVAVMPLANFTRDSMTVERVRDVLINKLLATGALYVLPVGEVARGTAAAQLTAPATPAPEEVVKLGAAIKVQAVITGAVKEYGEVRSGTAMANVISVSLQMMETQTGRIVWSASSTKGGIGTRDRLFGGGGQPMETITAEAIDDLIHKLFQ